MENKPFVLKADYQPAGDQPQAIAKLVEGFETASGTRRCWA